jgi:hypothetical protein
METIKENNNYEANIFINDNLEFVRAIFWGAELWPPRRHPILQIHKILFDFILIYLIYLILFKNPNLFSFLHGLKRSIPTYTTILEAKLVHKLFKKSPDIDYLIFKIKQSDLTPFC